MEHVQDNPLKKGWFLIILLLIIGIILRWYQLDVRPFHHDEALHAIYGKYFYMAPNYKFYRYDPMLHGPVLYHFLYYVYLIFGATKWIARSVITLVGSGLIFLPLLFRKYLNTNTIILLIACISLSPSLIYWSRFLRHDFLVLLSMTFMLIGYCLVSSRYKSFWIVLGITLHFCIKENAYITIILLLGYIIFEFIFNKFIINQTKGMLIQLIKNIKQHPFMLLFAILVGSFIYCYFYSGGFRYSAGIIDGLYRKSIAYWLHQHNIERIKGPFIFHVIFLSWYEFIFIISTLCYFFHFYTKTNWQYKITFILALLIAGIFHLVFSREGLSGSGWWQYFKIKIPIDFYVLFIVPTHAVTSTIYHIKNNQTKLAFWGYLFFASFFTYSFVGEKVPWLSIYPFVAGIIYLALYFQDNNIINKIFEIHIPKIKITLGSVILFVIVAFNLRIAIITNFINAGKNTEFISQVHTTEVYENLVYKIKDQIINAKESPPPKVLGFKHVWPLTWYLYGYKQYSFILGKNDLNSFDYIFTEKRDKESLDLERKLAHSHTKSIIPLRGWWVPSYKSMTWYNFLKYTFFHIPWNSVGNQHIAVYKKRPPILPND